MGKYKWKDCELTFNSREEEHQKITRLFIKHVNQGKQRFKSKYKSIVKGYDDNAIISMSELALEVYDGEIAELKKDMLAEKMYLRIDDMCSEINEVVFESVNDVQIEMLSIYYQLKGIQDQKIEKRKARKQSRGYWVGGGFGVKGAIKGAVEASILNIASGAAHSTFNAIGNFGTKVNMNLKVDKFIDGYGCDAMIQCIENGLMLVYHECLLTKKLDSLYTEALLSRHANVLKQYQDDNGTFAGERLFMNIKNNPYNIAQYEILIQRYGDKSKIFEKIGMNCGLNIEGIKRRILKEQCEGLSKNLDYQTLEYNYTFIQEKKEQLGYDGTFYLESETEKSLYRELSRELKRILNQTNQEDRDSVLNAIETVKKVKNKFNYGEEVYEQLQGYLNDIDINERTVAGKIYNTKSEADEVRKYYVGNVKHTTLEEVELSKKEKEKIKEIEKNVKNQGDFELDSYVEIYKRLKDMSPSSLYGKNYLESLEKTISSEYMTKENQAKLKVSIGDRGRGSLYFFLGVVLIPVVILGFFVGIIPGVIAFIIDANLFARAKENRDFVRDSKGNKRILKNAKGMASVDVHSGKIILKKRKRKWLFEFIAIVIIILGYVIAKDSSNHDFESDSSATTMENDIVANSFNTIESQDNMEDVAESVPLVLSNGLRYYIKPFDALQEGSEIYAIGTVVSKSHEEKISKEIGSVVYRYTIETSETLENGLKVSYWSVSEIDFDIQDTAVAYGKIMDIQDNFVYLTQCNIITYEDYLQFISKHPVSESQPPIVNHESEVKKEDSEYVYLIEGSDSRYLTESEVTSLSEEELRLARNEIFARHGRKFETPDLNEYFNQQPWYYGYLSAEEFDDTVLNEYEKANLDLIKLVENRNDTNVQDSANINWIGTYISEDGQSIEVTFCDENSVEIEFSGYSEEGWYTETYIMPYENTEKTQVSYEDTSIQKTIFTLKESAIEVKVLPSGSGREGMYIRQ